MKRVAESIVTEALDDLASRGNSDTALDMARGAVHLALMLDLIDIPEYRRRCDALIEARCGPTAGWHTGLSIRDYFAARLMAIELGREMRPHADYNYRNAATRAYAMADAMLAERAKEQA